MVNECIFIKILQNKCTALPCTDDLKIGGTRCISSGRLARLQCNLYRAMIFLKTNQENS